jgi:hypothetical protein
MIYLITVPYEGLPTIAQFTKDGLEYGLFDAMVTRMRGNNLAVFVIDSTEELVLFLKAAEQLNYEAEIKRDIKRAIIDFIVNKLDKKD